MSSESDSPRIQRWEGDSLVVILAKRRRTDLDSTQAAKRHKPTPQDPDHPTVSGLSLLGSRR